MPIPQKKFERLFRFLAPKELTAVLLVALCAVLITLTLKETEEITVGVLPRILFGCLAIKLVFCTVKRIRSLSNAIPVVHAGVFVTLIGAVISSFGYVATANIYEGTSVDNAYRWDVKEEVPLGFALTVKKIYLQYYPVPVKVGVGVLRRSEKYALSVLKTGESFSLDGYTVRADELVFPSENLRLSVFLGGPLVGTADTEGTRDLPPDFPYDFRLAAFKNPALKVRGWT